MNDSIMLVKYWIDLEKNAEMERQKKEIMKEQNRKAEKEYEKENIQRCTLNERNEKLKIGGKHDGIRN